MRLVTGRADDPSQDRDRTAEVVESVRRRGESALRVWQPPAQVAFGRRDSNREGYDRAREIVAARGVPAIERSTGGHAVYFTGSTVSFVLAEPVTDERTGIEDRYERTIGPIQSALGSLGVAPSRGEPDGAFCPGTHSLSADGKIVGLAQRVRRQVAVIAGVVVLRDDEQIASLLGPVYEALDIALDPDAVGSIARAGGNSDFGTVRDAIARELTPTAAEVDRVAVGNVHTEQV